MGNFAGSPVPHLNHYSFLNRCGVIPAQRGNLFLKFQSSFFNIQLFSPAHKKSRPGLLSRPACLKAITKRLI
jgi:hypothetical protein